MGLFKTLLGPFGLGLPLRPTTKRERFQYNSVAAQNQTNELLERLIDSIDTTGTATPSAPPSSRPRVAPAPNQAVWETGATITADVRSVIGQNALFVTDDGTTIAVGALDLSHFPRANFSTARKQLKIDVSAFGDSHKLSKFLEAGNQVEFRVSTGEYEYRDEELGLIRNPYDIVLAPARMILQEVDRAFDPKNRGGDAKRASRTIFRYHLTLTKVTPTGREESLRINVGEIVKAVFCGDGRQGLPASVELPDGRIEEIEPRKFSEPYRVREGLGHHWLIKNGDTVWLRVLPPAHKGLPTNWFRFQPVAPPATES